MAQINSGRVGRGRMLLFSLPYLSRSAMDYIKAPRQY